MDSVIRRIEEIEEAAQQIVLGAEDSKRDLEALYNAERAAFDAQMEKKTGERIAKIRSDADAKLSRLLEEENARQQEIIDNLEKEYEENHERYADEIIARILAR